MPLLVSPCELNDSYLIDDNYDNLVFVNIDSIDTNIEMPDDLLIKSATDNNYFYLRLDNNNGKKLSIIRLKKLEINNEKYFAICMSLSFIKGQGYARILYEYAFLNLDLPILSDKTNTKRGSSDLWTKLQKRQNLYGYEILVFNTQTQHKGKFIRKNYNDYDIWGWHLDFLEMAKEDPLFLDTSLNDGDIDIGLYNFLTKNINKVKNRTHIRLIGTKSS